MHPFLTHLNLTIINSRGRPNSGKTFVQALADMVAADERLALKAQHEAARRARLVATVEEARNLMSLDTAYTAQAMEQASRLQAATLEQRLRHLASAEASATDETLAAEGARMEAARDAAVAAVKERLEADEAWLAREQAGRDAVVAVKLVEVAAGVLRACLDHAVLCAVRVLGDRTAHHVLVSSPSHALLHGIRAQQGALTTWQHAV
jgi:hypothetical protein